MGLESEAEIRAELLRRVKEDNYVPVGWMTHMLMPSSRSIATRHQYRDVGAAGGKS
jgi:hypothetical protein